MIKTAQDIKSYKKQLKEALSDKFLRTALENFNTAYRENRPTVYQGIDFEGIKNEIAAGKDAALPYLTELFEEFKTHIMVHLQDIKSELKEVRAAKGGK